MIFSPRFRIWLAAQLVRGTPCVLTRKDPVEALLRTTQALHSYVESSGALQEHAHEGRLKAYKVLWRGTAGMALLAREILVGSSAPPPTPTPALPKEEAHASPQAAPAA